MHTRGFQLAPLLAGLVCFGLSSVSAQEIEWVDQFGTAGSDQALSVSADATSVYVAVSTTDDLAGQPKGAVVRKYSVLGEEIWTRQFGSPAMAGAVSAHDSGVYVAGYTSAALPGQILAPGRNTFVRRYDGDGNEIWSTQFGTDEQDTNPWFFPWPVIASDASGVYIAGFTPGVFPGQTSSGLNDAYVRKYSHDGVELWTHQFGTEGFDTARAVHADGAAVYVVGVAAAGLPGQTELGLVDAFVRKYSTDGDVVWTRQFGTSLQDVARTVFSVGGSVYVAGWTQGTLPGQVNGGDAQVSFDSFVCKYSSDGDSLWTRQFGVPGVDAAQAVSVANSILYVAGLAEDSCYLRAFDETGRALWTEDVQADGAQAYLESIATVDGRIYLAGSTTGVFPGEVNEGMHDAFVVKYAEDECFGPNLAANSGFEAAEETTSIDENPRPSQFDDWDGSHSEIVTSQNGVVPFRGTRMLRFIGTGLPTDTADLACVWTVCNVNQYIDLSHCREIVDSGSAFAEVTVRVNRVEGNSQETDMGFGVSASGFEGPIPETLSLEGALGLRGFYLESDSDPSTWEELAVTVPLPDATDFLWVAVSAYEDVVNDCENEFEGHYADEVTVRLFVEGRAIDNSFCDRFACAPDCCIDDTLEIVFPRGEDLRRRALEFDEFVEGDLVDVAVVSETRSDAVQGWSYGVKHDPAFLTLIEGSVTPQGTIVDVLEAPALSEFFTEVDGGWISAVVLQIWPRRVFLPVHHRNVLARASYRVEANPGASGTRVELVHEELAVTGSPPVAINITVDGTVGIPRRLSHGIVRSSPCDPPPIELNRSVFVSLGRDTPEHSYRFTPPPEVVGRPAILTVRGSEAGDASAVYLRWGSCASETRFDLAVDTLFQAEQRLAIPRIRDDDAYILVRGIVSEAAASSVTLELETVDLALESASADFAGKGGTERVSMSVRGVGFDEDVSFRLVLDETSIFAEETTIVWHDRAELTFALDTAPPGEYVLVAERQIGQSSLYAELPSVFEVLESELGPVLVVEVDSPLQHRNGRPARFVVKYHNVGDAEMAAPLLKVEAIGLPGSRLYFERDAVEMQEDLVGIGIAREDVERRLPPGSEEVLIVGVHPDGVAGRLPPGASGEVALILYPRDFDPAVCPDGVEPEAGGGCPVRDVTLRVSRFDPGPKDFIAWDELAAPEGISEAVWDQVWPALAPRVGSSWEDYAEALARTATELSHRGAGASSVRTLFRHMFRRAAGRPSSAILGGVRLAEDLAPLAEVCILAYEGNTPISGTVTDAEGKFALENVSAGKTYELRVIGHELEDPVQATVTVPPEGDLLAIDLAVQPAGGANDDELPSLCSPGHEDGLPQQPLEAPLELFTPMEEKDVEILSSWDPNEKESSTPGSEGDDGGVIGPGEDIFYTIFFENKGDAALPARRVTIVDRLDPRLDWRTLRLTDVRIGIFPAQLRVLDLTGTDLFSDYSTNVAASRYATISQMEIESYSIEGVFVTQSLVELTVLIVPDDENPEIMKLVWDLKLMTDSPLGGFLIPNDRFGQGEGSVSFSIRPRTDLIGERFIIDNDADIFFDSRGPIRTCGDEADQEPCPSVRHVLDLRAPPEAPRFPSPREGATNVSPSTVFWWQGPRADSYEFLLWPEGTPPPASGRIVESPFLAPRDLLIPGADYQWQVIARGSQDIAGPVWSFRVREPVEPPQASFNLAPENGQIVGLNPELRWTPSAGAQIYDLYVWPASALSLPKVPALPGIGSTSVQVGNLEDRTEYLWQVVPRNRGGDTPGEIWSFTTDSRTFLRGDCNADHTLDVSDAIASLSYQFLGDYSPSCLDACDFDDSGTTAITDPIQTMQHLFLGDHPPPSPGKELCGPDPTEDELDCLEYECPESVR